MVWLRTLRTFPWGTLTMTFPAAESIESIWRSPESCVRRMSPLAVALTEPPVAAVWMRIAVAAVPIVP